MFTDGATAAGLATACLATMLTGWRRHRSPCMSCLRGRAHRWRRRFCPVLSDASLAFSALHSRLPAFSAPRILGTGISDGCEGTSCGSEAWPRRWCLVLVNVIRRRLVLAAFLLSFTSDAPKVSHGGDGAFRLGLSFPRPSVLSRLTCACATNV